MWVSDGPDSGKRGVSNWDSSDIFEGGKASSLHGVL